MATYNDWANSLGIIDYKESVAELVAMTLTEDFGIIFKAANDVDASYDLVKQFVRKLLTQFKMWIGHRTLLPSDLEFTNKISMILINVLPEFINSLEKYGFIKKYYDESTFGYISKTNDITAQGTIAIGSNANEYTTSTDLTNGYNKNQSTITDTSYDLQSIVKSNLSFGAFWRLNYFELLLNRIEPLLLGVVVHEL